MPRGREGTRFGPPAGGSGHGDRNGASGTRVIDHDPSAGPVTRTLLGVDTGALQAGPGRWNQYVHAGTPRTWIQPLC